MDELSSWLGNFPLGAQFTSDDVAREMVQAGLPQPSSSVLRDTLKHTKRPNRLAIAKYDTEADAWLALQGKLTWSTGKYAIIRYSFFIVIFKINGILQ